VIVDGLGKNQDLLPQGWPCFCQGLPAANNQQSRPGRFAAPQEVKFHIGKPER